MSEITNLLKAITKKIPDKIDWIVQVEGHTDNIPISNDEFPSNWELSVARASVIASFLESKKISTDRIQVAGYGDSRPRFNPDTAYKRNLNRRVQILLMPEDFTR